MATVRKIIKRALIVGRILTKNDTMSSSEAEDGQDTLNSMLSAMSNSSLLVYARTSETFTLTSGTATYSIGSGGDFDTTRPIRIVAAYVRNGTEDFPLQIISDSTYLEAPDKSTLSMPTQLKYSNSYPTGNITLYPTPSESYTLGILTEKPFSVLSLDDEFSFPPGWEEMIVYNLAIRLCGEYGVQAPQEVIFIAKESKADVKSAVAKTRPIIDKIGTISNIYTGYYN